MKPIISDNGDIDFAEFCGLMSKHLKDPGDEEQELREAFAVFDRNGIIYFCIYHTTKHLHSGTFVLNCVMFMFRSGGLGNRCFFA